MKISKILSILLVTAMLLSCFAACNNAGNVTEETTVTPEAPTTEAPTTEVPTEKPTEAPTTEAPTTEEPTEAPTTEAPTEEPTTEEPTTEEPTTEEPEVGIKVGTGYNIGMVQTNANKTVYLIGGMNGYYMDTAESIGSALVFYVEEANSGYYLYTEISGVKTYVNMVVSGTHVNGAYEASPSTVYTYDETLETLVATVNDALYAFGTRNDKTYTTIGPVAVSNNPFMIFFAKAGTITPDDPNGGDNTSGEITMEYVTHDVWTDYQIITLATAIKICNANSTATTERYYICGTIKTVKNAQYGSMIITDGVNELEVYGTYSSDGSIGYASMTDKPYKDDEVLLYCTLQVYNGTPEVANARLIDYIKSNKEIDESEYTKVTIAEAREATVGTKLSVTGVVAAITYANGKIPSGVYLVDGTESIYVYSGDVAQRVKVGNTITVIGSRDNWILADETNNAAKFGYKGCCQISDATLMSNDEGNTEFDKTWIPETTVKEILATPVTENITSTIFKVTALVKKVPGSGFVNYYFFDIDGETGTYTYTQCNGSDFAWLDEFDGKICTVYISALNAKSTASDCYFRFVPVAVVYENYQFDTTKAPEYAVKYHGVDQFMPSYSGDPALELLTNIDSELLGFTGATLSYTSSNTSVVYFTTEDGKTVMHCTGSGTVTITITGSYNGATYAQDVTVTIKEPEAYEYVSVETAINAAVGEEVIVKGIVGPGIANKSGFYLIDETGAIAIQCDASQFDGLMIGHEVIIKGISDITKDGGGQINLKDAVILVNYYGNHEYSTDSFVTDKTIEEIAAIADSANETTTVYVVTATVEKTSKQQGSYTNVTFNVGGVLLYSGSAAQYSWLESFFADGETSATLTVELALCDWNAKGLKGCVLAVITEDGKTCNRINFTAYN